MRLERFASAPETKANLAGIGSDAADNRLPKARCWISAEAAARNRKIGFRPPNLQQNGVKLRCEFRKGGSILTENRFVI